LPPTPATAEAVPGQAQERAVPSRSTTRSRRSR
jgi:hypothetical protein